MKIALIISIKCILLFGVLPQTIGQSMSNQQINLIESQIDSLFQLMINQIEKKEYEKMTKAFDDRRLTGIISNGTYYTNYSTIADNAKTMASNVKNHSFTLEQKKTTVLSDRIVLLTASGTTNIIFNNGNEFRGNVAWSFVYEKIDNNWKVIHSHESVNR